VFSESDQKFTRKGQADSEGLFEARNLPNGQYRLRVIYDRFCAANVSILLENGHMEKRIAATMNPSEVHGCSYVKWKQPSLAGTSRF
jgi:hypothetical protein